MARRKFDQYFRPGAVGLARETDSPDTDVAGDLEETNGTSRFGVAIDGQRTAAGQLNGTKQIRPRTGITRLQQCALVLTVVLTGVAALLGARTWSALIPIGVSALLSGVVWTTSVSLLRALRSADSVVATRPELIDLKPGHSRPARLEPRQAGLLLAIALSLLWLVWVKPTAWQAGLAAAVTVALATRSPQRLEHQTGVFAHRIFARPARNVARRIGVLSRIHRTWGRVTAVSFVSSHKWSMDERTPRHRRPGRKLACEEDVAPTVTFPAITDEIPATAVEPAPRRHHRPRGRHKALWYSPLTLLLILGVQAGLSLRLVWSNTAFTDEALYLWAGRQELASLLHGTPSPVFSSYFSGAPVIYPVLGALANDIGGLTGARLLSLGFMLGATALLWVTTRRLYGDLAAAFAAGSWAVLGPTLHLSAFATYDAMSMFLIALAVCLATTRRTREVETTWMMVAAAVALALANATVYSSFIFDPVVVLLAIFCAQSRPGSFAALRRGVLVSTVTLIVIYGGFWIGGDNYISGVAHSVLSRQNGTTLPSEVLVEAFRWTGAVVIAAVAGVILAAVRRKDRHDIRLLSVCVLAAILVPLEQAHIHTDTSLNKHADMGVWFAAIVVGYAVSKLITAWRPAIFRVAVTSAVLAGVAAMAVAGFPQGKALFSWPNSASYLSVVRPIVARTPGPLLIENDAIPEYYLPAGQDWQRWSSTFAITLLSGRTVGYASKYASKVDTSANLVVYEALLKRGYFSLIIIDYSVTPGLDGVLLSYLRHDPDYHIVGTIPGIRAGTSTPIWERTNPADRSSK